MYSVDEPAPFSSWVEAGSLVRLAGPAALAFTLAHSAGLVEIAILGHLHADPTFNVTASANSSTAFLSSAALAGTWMDITDVWIYAGLAAAVQILSARSAALQPNDAAPAGSGDGDGEGDAGAAPAHTRARGARTLLAAGVLAVLLGCLVVAPGWWFAGDILGFFLNAGQLQGCGATCMALATSYARIALAWLPAFAATKAIANFLRGQDHVTPGPVANTVFLCLGGLLVYFLVLGLHSGHGCGFPPAPPHGGGRAAGNSSTRPRPGPPLIGNWMCLGFRGGPVGTGIVRWIVLLWMLVSLRRHGWCCGRDGKKPARSGNGNNAVGNTRGAPLPPSPPPSPPPQERGMRYILGQLCAAATPLALGGIVEELQISVIAMFAAHLGMAQLGAHYGAMRVLLVLQAVNYGLVQATAVRIGGHLLDRNVPSAKHVMRICLVLSAVWGSVVGGVFYLARRYVGFIFR